jgi:puromycin-sensitive aminopeptidase
MARLAEDLRPEAYALHVSVDPRKQDFRGEIEIELAVTPGTREISLHAVDLQIGSADLEDESGPVGISQISDHPEHEILRFGLARGIRSPRARLRIAYQGPLRSDLRGLYLARSGRRPYAVTQLEATDARRFFPCFDEPDKKARFRISVTTPSRYQVISNAPIQRRRTSGRSRTVVFAETPRLSTYLIALVVGELEGSRTRRCGTTPIRVWSVPGKRHLTGFALDAAAASLERLEQYFGLPYPYQKLDLIAVPEFEFGAMENAGAVTFRENLLLVDPKTVSLSERKRVAEVIAHELAHMWYGDLVTMAWWDDLWLNEAFATWMAFRIIDDWRPDWQMWLDFEHQRSTALALDALRNTHPVYTDVTTPDEATQNFDAITYTKGASVVRMLERWLGPQAFRRGVRQYIRRHRESNARAADLWEALEKASGRPLAPLVRAWIERPGFPLLSVSRADRGGRAWLEVKQERFFANPSEPEQARKQRWPVPTLVRVRPPAGRSRIVRGLLRAAHDQLALGRSRDVRWVYANAEEAGFYHPLHDTSLLREIASELPRLIPVERMGLVGHQWAGVCANRAAPEDFLALVEALQDEKEPEVLHAIMGPLSWLKDNVVPNLYKSPPAPNWPWLNGVFGGAFRELGWRVRRGETDRVRLRRTALLQIVGVIGEEAEIAQEAEEQLSAFFKNPAALDPNLIGPVVEITARHGDRLRYDRFLRRMRQARTPQERTRFEMALASFRRSSLIMRTLRLTLTPDVPTQDVVLLLSRLLANPAAREKTWCFIQERWKRLSPRISPGLAARLVSALPALQTRRHRQQVASFFQAHPLPTATRALEQALERFDLDASLRKRATPALRRWLSQRERRSR